MSYEKTCRKASNTIDEMLKHEFTDAQICLAISRLYGLSEKYTMKQIRLRLEVETEKVQKSQIIPTP